MKSNYKVVIGSFFLGVLVYVLFTRLPSHFSSKLAPVQVTPEVSGLRMQMSFFPGTHRPEEAEPFSDLVVIAEIIEIGQARWNTPDGLRPDGWAFNSESIENWLIYTPVTFRVNEKYKGEFLETTSQFAIVGGHVGDDWLEIDASEFGFYSDIQLGDKVILFLTKNTEKMLNVAPYGYVDALRIEKNGKATPDCSGDRTVGKCRVVFNVSDVLDVVKSKNK